MLLSIVVPTHNRQKYAKGCIDSLIEIASEEVEVLVSDSSTDNELSRYVELHYLRNNIRVLKPQNVNNAVENFNFAIAHAKGHYVLIIGDDDTVLPNIVELLQYLKDKSVEAVRFNFPYEYFWDDCYETQKKLNNTVRSTPFTCEVTESSSIGEAIKVGSNLGHGVLDMPRAYLGVVSRPLIDRINNKYGELFGGVSPDIYSSVLISYESAKTVIVDYPVVIPGSSGASTSGKSVNGKHVSELLDNEHLTAFPDLVWDKKIPAFYSTHTVWAFSYVQASNVIKNASGFKLDADFYRLYIKCFYTYNAYFKYTFESFKFKLAENYLVGFFKFCRSLIKESCWIFMRIAHRFVVKKLTILEKVESLSDCQKIILEDIDNKKVKIIYKV